MAKYSLEFKLEVVQNYLSNDNDDGFRKTAHKFELDQGTVRQWTAVYQTQGADGLKYQTKRIEIHSLSVLKYRICMQQNKYCHLIYRSAQHAAIPSICLYP